MTTTTILETGYLAIQDYLVSIDCTEDTRNRYRLAFASLKEYFSSAPECEFTPERNHQYREKLKQEHLSGLLSAKKLIFLRRVSYMLDDFYYQRPFQLRYSNGKRYKHDINDNFLPLIEQFKESLTISEISIPEACSIARDFFYYFQQTKNVNSLQIISVDELAEFLNQEYCSHKKSMNNVLCYLSKLLVFLESQGVSVPDPDMISYKAAPTRHKIYPAFEENDLDILIKSPDRKSKMGKRDYAVLLLASFTGMRAIDIANLKVENINRAERAISFTQHKTGFLNAVPVDETVTTAIDDYIRNARPDCDLPYVFLTMNKPYRKLNDMASVRNIVYRYIRTSGIEKSPWDGKSFHAFRRTIGKWLLESSEDTQMISQVLGHRSQDVLKRYLPLSMDILRECALDFSFAPLTTEVFK